MNGKICLCFKKTLSLSPTQTSRRPWGHWRWWPRRPNDYDGQGAEGGDEVDADGGEGGDQADAGGGGDGDGVDADCGVGGDGVDAYGDFDLLRGLVQVGGDHLDGDRQGARLVSLQEERLR